MASFVLVFLGVFLLMVFLALRLKRKQQQQRRGQSREQEQVSLYLTFVIQKKICPKRLIITICRIL